LTSSPDRRGYLDWLRGLGVLIMIEAHTVDAWTRLDARNTTGFRNATVLGGFAAPLFLWLAGLGVAIAASRVEARDGRRAAAAAACRRGLEIFVLAFLFRLQAFLLTPGGELLTVFRVDILNVMGPSIVAGVGLWLLGRSAGSRVALFIAATIALVVATPAIRHAEFLAALPNALEAYLRPVPGLSNFTFFPWAAFVSGGAVIGVLLDSAREQTIDRRTNLAFIAAGIGLAGVAYAASFLPPLDPRSRFWTTSVSFFLLRIGLMVAAVGVAWLWEQRPGAGKRWSPLQVLGTSSLFVYWVHVELVYGLVSNPLHGAFSLPAAWAALVLFCLLMLGLTVAKRIVVDKWRNRKDLRDKLDRPVEPLMY